MCIRDRKKMDADGNVIAAVDWDEQDGNDKLYHWILAASLQDNKEWEPLDVRQICEQMQSAGSDKEDESSGPPGMESSSDDEPEAESPKHADEVTSSAEDTEDESSDFEYLENLSNRD